MLFTSGFIVSRIMERSAAAAVRRELDAAFRVSDAERVEALAESYGRGGMELLDPEATALTFVIHLVDGPSGGINSDGIPLFVTCSKPGHADAWVEAFRVVMAWSCPTIDWGIEEGRGGEECDVGIESYPSDWRCSTIDWGVDDES